MFKIPKQAYTAEFKEQAVKRVTEVGSMSRVAEDLGLVEQTLRNWVKAAKAGTLNPAGVKALTPEQMELSRLRAEVSRLRMECEILKKRRRTSREIPSEVRLDRHATYPLPAMYSVLEVSVSGYRAWTHGGTPHRTRLTEAQMLALIRAIHDELKGAYGSPRMVRELRGRGCPASKPRVERLRREHGIRARHTRRYKVTTDSTHHLPVAANRLNRHFTPSAPNQVWTSAITYLWTDEGWLYLAIVLDLFNREVVGWSLKPRMTADIVTDALTMAWFRRNPAVGLRHHSDRGSQYASQPFQDTLKAYGMEGSMSRKGNGWDHAPTESWVNLDTAPLSWCYPDEESWPRRDVPLLHLLAEKSYSHAAFGRISETPRISTHAK